MSPGDEWFPVLARALESAGSPLGAAELHGGLCGVLCAGGPDAVPAWLGTCSAEIKEICARIGTASWTELAGGEMAFTPLLPNDDTALPERVRALAAWCAGFVSGLGQGAAGFEGALGASDEVTEVIGDFVEIGKANLDVEADGGDEGAEAAYAEVAEFVRVGVQIVFEELGQTLRWPGGVAIH
jgi:uncharacterized protein YgfB (UPF0149 family)